jgi:RHS repeat-associated protein
MSGLVTGTKVGNVTTTHEHNRFGEVKRFSTAFKDKEIFAVEYERDHAGRIVKKAETVEGQTRTFGYTYDLAGRLTKLASDEGQESVYEYDSNGNRLAYKGPLGHSKGTYDAQDRLVAYSGEPYRYTANGELASKGAGGKTTSYDYDALGNLRRVNLTGGPRLDYVIDGANRRIGKKVNGKLVQGLLYGDQLKPVAELDGRNEVVSVFVYGTKVNMPEYVQKQDGIYRIVTDHLGSPRLVINVETGTIAQKMDYDEFGNVVQDTNPGFQPFGFAGGLYDPHTKLTRFGSRDYDAAVGRWTAKDPVRFAGAETNLYAYAYNDPNNFVDFNGLNGETTSFKVWSQGGNVEGTTRGFTYTGSGYAQSPSPGGGVSFGGEASFEGPVGPGTVNIDFTGSGTFGPEGTQGTFTGRADYTVPVGYGLDFRGDVSVSGDFSGEGSWGGEGSFGFGRGNTACRIGGRVGGDFHGNTTVQTTIQLPF